MATAKMATADGQPKDYSQIYKMDGEDYKPPRTVHINAVRAAKASLPPGPIDMDVLCAKLQPHSILNQTVYPRQALHNHYETVFTGKKFKIYIQYYNEKEAFIIYTRENILREILDKLPKSGNYRYFFKTNENMNEEIENERSVVPYHEKDGQNKIFCQIFPARPRLK